MISARESCCYIEQSASNSWSIYLIDEDENERRHLFEIMRADSGDMDEDDGWDLFADKMCDAINTILNDADDRTIVLLDEIGA